MMAPTRVECGYPDCSYVSENDSEQVAILQFQSHMSGHEQSKGQPISTKQKLPPIERPILKQDVNEEEWETRNGGVSNVAPASQRVRRLTSSSIVAKRGSGASC